MHMCACTVFKTLQEASRDHKSAIIFSMVILLKQQLKKPPRAILNSPLLIIAWHAGIQSLLHCSLGC